MFTIFTALLAFEVVSFLLFVALYATDSANSYFYFLVAAVLAVLTFFFGFTIFTVANIPNIIAFVVLYTGAGVIWSFFKWYRYTHSDSAVTGQVAAWKRYSERQTDASDKETFIKSSDNPLNYRNSNNQRSLHRWVIYWPFSVIGDILGDFLLNAVKYIVSCFGGIYDAIAGGTKNLA